MDPKDFGPHGGPVGEYARLVELVRVDPLAAWSRLLEVSAWGDDVDPLWVADILEDLVNQDPERFAPLIEAELARNPPLRRAFVDYFAPYTANEAVASRLLTLRDQLESEGR